MASARCFFSHWPSGGRSPLLASATVSGASAMALAAARFLACNQGGFCSTGGSASALAVSMTADCLASSWATKSRAAGVSQAGSKASAGPSSDRAWRSCGSSKGVSLPPCAHRRARPAAPASGQRASASFKRAWLSLWADACLASATMASGSLMAASWLAMPAWPTALAKKPSASSRSLCTTGASKCGVVYRL